MYLVYYLSDVHGSFWPHGTDDVIGWIKQKSFEVLKQSVLVFIQESTDVVHNIPCIMSVKHKFKFFPFSWFPHSKKHKLQIQLHIIHKVKFTL